MAWITKSYERSLQEFLREAVTELLKPAEAEAVGGAAYEEDPEPMRPPALRHSSQASVEQRMQEQRMQIVEQITALIEANGGTGTSTQRQLRDLLSRLENT